MVIEKIEHYLGVIFFTLLVVCQALVFVAVKAVDNQGALEAVYIEPTAGSELTVGQVVNIEAMLSTAEFDNFSSVYFTLTDQTSGSQINYEADLKSDGIWRAQSSWDTSLFQPGAYYISATAKVYQDNQWVDSLESQPQPVYLVGNYQAAATTNYDTNNLTLPEDLYNTNTNTNDKTIDNVVDTNTNTNTNTNTDAPSDISENQTEVLSVNIVSPQPGAEISGDLDIEVELTGRSLTDQEMLILSLGGKLYQLASLAGTAASYGGLIDTAEVDQNGDAIFANGDYPLQVGLLSGDPANSPEYLGSGITITINNPVVLSEPQILILSPADGQVITADKLTVNIETVNYNPETLSVEIFDIYNTAVTSGAVAIPKTDGYHWNTTLTLGDELADGEDYTLLVSGQDITDPGEGAVQASIFLTLERSLAPVPPQPEDIELLLQVPNSELNANSYLVASSQIAPNTDLEFVFESNNHEVKPLKAIAVPCGSDLIAFARPLIENSGHKYCFYRALYNLPADTGLISGNYYLYARDLGGVLGLSSQSRAVSYFADDSSTEADSDGDNISSDQMSTTSDEEIADQAGETEDQEKSSDSAGINNENSNQPATQVNQAGSLGIDLYTTCFEAGISDQNQCLAFRATMDMLDPACISEQIYQAEACEDYLNKLTVDRECQAAGVVDQEKCKDYLLESYGSQVNCQLSDQNICTDVLRNRYLNRLVLSQQRSNVINQIVSPLLDNSTKLEELRQNLAVQGIDEADTLPIVADDNSNIRLIPAVAETVLEDENRLTTLNQAAMIIDSDGDGLMDDLERYYGTDPYDEDSDGDGYNDGTEIKNGYDPLGPSQLAKAEPVLARLIFANTAIEQPKNKSTKIDHKYEIVSVLEENKKIQLKGRAEADSWINIFLYSDLPLLMTTKTDASGNWSYDIQPSLTDGYHRVYVTVNDDTGKIVKQSSPVSFLIKEAQAVGAQDYFDNTPAADSVNNMLIYYIGGAVFLVLLALGAIIYLYRHRRPELEV